MDNFDSYDWAIPDLFIEDPVDCHAMIKDALTRGRKHGRIYRFLRQFIRDFFFVSSAKKEGVIDYPYQMQEWASV
jgi:hypothetical protein